MPRGRPRKEETSFQDDSSSASVFNTGNILRTVHIKGENIRICSENGHLVAKRGSDVIASGKDDKEVDQGISKFFYGVRNRAD